MNWIDIIVVLIIIFSIGKGLSLGLILSIFNIIQIILSILITNRYYLHIYGYIRNSSKISNMFKKIINIFSSSDTVSDSILKIVITVFSVMFMFFISQLVINLILQVFSFITMAPILKNFNQIGGVVFGLIKGLLIVYILHLFLSPIAYMYPRTFIGRGILNSFTYDYLEMVPSIFNLLFTRQFKDLGGFLWGKIATY